MVKKILHGLRRPSNYLWLVPIVLFFIATQVWSQNKIAILTNGLDIGVWVFILRAYLPPFISLLRKAGDKPELGFFGGIITISTALAASRIWSLAIILMGKPAWMLNYWFQSFCYFMIAVGMFYLLRVPTSEKSGWYIVGAIVIAIVVTIFGLAFVEN